MPGASLVADPCVLYHLDLISSPKDYVEILDDIMPIEKGIGLFDGIIGISHAYARIEKRFVHLLMSRSARDFCGMNGLVELIYS